MGWLNRQEQRWGLSCSLLCPQCLEQWPAHSRCSANIVGLNKYGEKEGGQQTGRGGIKEPPGIRQPIYSPVTCEKNIDCHLLLFYFIFGLSESLLQRWKWRLRETKKLAKITQHRRGR